MDKIKICSLNCQGLGDVRKRRDVISHLRSQNFSILCLQDTHFTKNIEKLIQTEWGYKVFFSSFTSQSRGVAVFIKNNFEFVLHNTHHDPGGNFLLLDAEIENNRITLVNLYGPNKDDPSFYENLQKLITQQGNKNILIVGDWNLLLDPTIDSRNYKNINNPKARQQVLKMIGELNLYDVWREENGNELKFTWKRKLKNGCVQRGRLDFFLVSEALANYTSEEEIRPGYRSDHLIVSLTLDFNNMPKCKTYWKFNNSLLKNTEYAAEIKQVISNTKKQYAATPYNRNNIEQIDDNLLQTTINPQLFFEMILLEIRKRTIAFSTSKAREENEKKQRRTF